MPAHSATTGWEARRFALWLGAIVVAGAAIRVLYTVLFAPAPTRTTDEFFYSNVAQFVAHGRGFIQPGAAYAGRSVATAAHPPLYVLVLAGVAKLGGTTELAQRLTGPAFGAGTIAVVGLLGRRLGGVRAGLLAAGVAAVYPILIGADGALMSESLFGLLVALSLLTAYRLAEAPNWRRALTFGAVAGLAALTRGEAILLPILVLAPLVRRPQGRRAAALAFVALVVVLTPWTVRNWIVFGRLVPISTNSALTIAGGNCPSVYSGASIGAWDLSCVRTHAGNEAAQAEAQQADGLRYAADHLGRLPLVMAARLARLWSLKTPSSLPVGRTVGIQRLGVGVYFVLLPLALFGFLTLRRRGRPTWILMTPVVLVSVTAVLSVGEVRLREPADVVLAVLAGIALDELARRLRPAAPRAARRETAEAT